MSRLFGLSAPWTLVLCLIAGGWFPASAEIVTFQENFTSWQYRDASLTSADWDTLAGRLELLPVGLDSLARVSTPGSAYASDLQNQVLFVGLDNSDALASYDLADPESPQLLDTFGTLDGVRDVLISGSYAYLTVGTAGLQTVNLADPGDMVGAGILDLPGFAYGIALQGNRLYAAQAGSGVAVVDVSSPSNPTLIEETPGNDWARDVAVANNHLFLADGIAGLTVMSISNPDNPVIVGSLDTENICYAVTVEGNRCYLASGTGGMVIVDVSDPSDPTERATLNFPGNGSCRFVATAGDTVYAAVNDRGLFAIDVSDPFAPEIIANFDTPGAAYHVTLDAPYIWVSDASAGLMGFQLNPDALDEQNNRAQSIDLIGEGEPVSRARLTATFTDSVRFALTVDGGSSWYPVEPGGEWITFSEAGEDLRWRAFLVNTDDEAVPTCENLTLEYEKLHGYGGIAEVMDVPGDAGGQVRLVWEPSRYDVPDADHLVTEYSIYRRYSPLLSRGAAPDLTYPDGSWDYLTSVPADMETGYAAVVPTLADSTISEGMAWSVFFIRTRTATPGTFYDSPPDSGYSVNNLRPAPPTGLQVDYNDPEGTRLTWDDPALPDFAHFCVYRSPNTSTPPQPATLFQVTTGTEMLDTDSGVWHYLLTVVNLAGQESEPASPLSPSFLDQPHLQLHPAAPNPFNPRTWLGFTVPTGGARVELVIYDARGHLIRNLVTGQFSAGFHRVPWDGNDRQGRPVASGVYQGRITSGSHHQVVKMLLVR